MNAAFDAVSALFLVLIVGLAVMAVRWGIRRDRAARGDGRTPGP
jgi:hypothetical protein